jgi:hypothetical protein
MGDQVAAKTSDFVACESLALACPTVIEVMVQQAKPSEIIDLSVLGIPV